MTDQMEIEEFPECPILVDPSRWVYAKTCFKLDSFYSDLSCFLLQRFPNATHLKSAIDFQKNMVVMPEYSSQVGKSFSIDRDWPAFFAAAAAQIEYQKMEEPAGFSIVQGKSSATCIESDNSEKVRECQEKPPLPGQQTFCDEPTVQWIAEIPAKARIAVDFGNGKINERWQRWLMMMLCNRNMMSYSNYSKPLIKACSVNPAGGEETPVDPILSIGSKASARADVPSAGSHNGTPSMTPIPPGPSGSQRFGWLNRVMARLWR